MSDNVQSSAPCIWMRGGTSKGAFFLADDLPNSTAERDDFLLRVMGSPDPNQIDGIGGADPLTSKVAIVSKSAHPDADVDYLFLQVFVEEARVGGMQNCGNLLASVGPFALEKGLVSASGETTTVRIFARNTEQIVEARFATPNGELTYDGDCVIDGVPESANSVSLTFEGAEGAICGSLLPTGTPKNSFDGIDVTCIDAGMPTVILRAKDLNVTGQENRQQLDSNKPLKTRLETIRLQAGEAMGLGNVKEQTIPKMTIVSTPRSGGTIATRTFIPHRCHASIGVMGAVSVATACLTAGSLAANMAATNGKQNQTLSIEHPLGKNIVEMSLDKNGKVGRAAVIRTARKLFEGTVYAGPPRTHRK